MPTIEALRTRRHALLTQFHNDLPVKLADGVEEENSPFRGRPDFTIFYHPHLVTAITLVETWAQMLDKALADGTDELEALDQTLDAVEAAFQTQNADLVIYALTVLITQHPVAQPLHVSPLRDIYPLLLLPANRRTGAALEGGLGNEAKLDYYREAEQYNEHHAKWHRVFPGAGSNLTRPDRQGELFWYMHQQMLARYDTERRCLGLPLVQALTDYRAVIPEGYQVEAGQAAMRYTSRSANLKLHDFPTYPVSALEQERDAIREATQNGYFQAGARQIPITPNTLGGVLEPNIGAIAQNVDLRRFYGSLHNDGHGFLAALSPGNTGGVMGNTITAVRDPVFYRWHRHIDDLFVEWQDKQDENDWQTGAPPVRLRKDANGESLDIGLALLADLPGAPANGAQFDGAAFGATNFGADAWDSPLQTFEGNGKPLTKVLYTRLATEVITPPSGPVTKNILDQDEFAYFLRLENTADTPQRVTVRIFLAATELAESRRHWIEMDKFLYSLDPNEKAVVYRPARLASVTRKPAARPTEEMPEGDDLCDCGWPYHMLLPRGTATGTAFQLCVILTDAEQDLANPAIQSCGSISFCGARNSRYPDLKPMGYPFDRPFHTHTISETLHRADLPHVGVKPLLIQHVGG